MKSFGSGRSPNGYGGRGGDGGGGRGLSLSDSWQGHEKQVMVQ